MLWVMGNVSLMNGGWQNSPFHPDIFLNTRCFQGASTSEQPTDTKDFVVCEEIRLLCLLILCAMVERMTRNKLSIPKVTWYWFLLRSPLRWSGSSGFPTQSPVVPGDFACLRCNWPRYLHGNAQASPGASISIRGPVWCFHRTESCYSPSLQTYFHKQVVHGFKTICYWGFWNSPCQLTPPPQAFPAALSLPLTSGHHGGSQIATIINT